MLLGSAFACGAEPDYPDPATLPPSSLKLMRSFEYTNSVRDIVGVEVSQPLPEDLVRASFSSISAANDCYSDVRIEQFETIALEVAAEAFAASPTPLDAVGCTPSSALDACVGEWVDSFGRRVFRRPLDDQERARYLSLIVNLTNVYEGDVSKGAEFALAAFLQSPHFLYRVELGEEIKDQGGLRKFDDYEMASRLAYGLWETAPDDELLDAAKDGRLGKRGTLTAEVERMLADPRADEALTRFWREHLGIDRLTLANYPKEGATDTLYSDMRAEGQVLAERLIAPGTDALTYLTTSEAALSSQLADFYGADADWGISSTLPANRQGFLTSGAFLASHAHPDKSSPTRRGKFIIERVLCGTVPPPPPGVDFDLPSVPEGQATQREVLEQHREDPACSACHQVMDPAGFAFENFDALGRYRELDNGLPVDATGQFEGQDFKGATQLIAYLVDAPATTRCVAKQAYRSAIGTVETASEEANIDTLSANYEAEDRAYRTLMREIVLHDAFRYAKGFIGEAQE